MAAGYEVPDQSATAMERVGNVVVDQNSAEELLADPITHRLSIGFLWNVLLEHRVIPSVLVFTMV